MRTSTKVSIGSFIAWLVLMLLSQAFVPRQGDLSQEAFQQAAAASGMQGFAWLLFWAGVVAIVVTGYLTIKDKREVFVGERAVYNEGGRGTFVTGDIINSRVDRFGEQTTQTSRSQILNDPALLDALGRLQNMLNTDRISDPDGLIRNLISKSDAEMKKSMPDSDKAGAFLGRISSMLKEVAPSVEGIADIVKVLDQTARALWS